MTFFCQFYNSTSFIFQSIKILLHYIYYSCIYLLLQGYSPTTELSPAKRFCLSTSLSRFDNVRRRQMIRMKKRTNWFLSPNDTMIDSSTATTAATSAATSSAGTSASCTEESYLDVDMSGAGLRGGHSTGHVEDLDASHTASLLLGTSSSSSAADVVNGNHHRGLTSTPAGRRWPPVTSTGATTTANSSTAAVATAADAAAEAASGDGGSVRERDVRCFMVDNYYGSKSRDPSSSAYTTGAAIRAATAGGGGSGSAAAS